MSTAVESLLAFADRDDPFGDTTPELRAMALAAAAERFEEHRQRIPALAKRAKDVGCSEIATVDDLVPLMFAHTSYKTYPVSFVQQKRWDRMAKWLETICAAEIRDVDWNGVEDIDDWAARLREHGHHLFISSGTTGKNSFVYHTSRDIENFQLVSTRYHGWPQRNLARDNSYGIVSLGSGPAPSAAGYAYEGRVKFFGRPGDEHYNEPIRYSELSRVNEVRKAIADGTASPEQIARFESEARTRSERMAESVARLCDLILDRRADKLMVNGFMAAWWRLREQGRERGIPNGSFNAESVCSLSGGPKGAALPEGWLEDVVDWVTPALPTFRYGMSEITTSMPLCEANRYHVAPWITFLVLDETGLVLLPREGTVTGRAAFFDPILEGRWGGVVTGDKVTAHFRVCECGRPGPVIERDVTRFGAGSVAGDDKLLCSAAVDAYVRETVGAET